MGNTRSEIHILMITSRKHAGLWIFPKGTVEPNEDLVTTAVRETVEVRVAPIQDLVQTVSQQPFGAQNFQEAGVTGTIRAPLFYNSPGKQHAMFLLEVEAYCNNWKEVS